MTVDSGDIQSSERVVAIRRNDTSLWNRLVMGVADCII